MSTPDSSAPHPAPDEQLAALQAQYRELAQTHRELRERERILSALLDVRRTAAQLRLTDGAPPTDLPPLVVTAGPRDPAPELPSHRFSYGTGLATGAVPMLSAEDLPHARELLAQAVGTLARRHAAVGRPAGAAALTRACDLIATDDDAPTDLATQVHDLAARLHRLHGALAPIGSQMDYGDPGIASTMRDLGPALVPAPHDARQVPTLPAPPDAPEPIELIDQALCDLEARQEEGQRPWTDDELRALRDLAVANIRLLERIVRARDGSVGWVQVMRKPFELATQLLLAAVNVFGHVPETRED